MRLNRRSYRVRRYLLLVCALASLALASAFLLSPTALATWTVQDQSLPCYENGEWTGTSFDDWPLYQIAGPTFHFDPRKLPGAGPINATIVGNELQVFIEEVFGGPATETVAGVGTRETALNITWNAPSLTGTVVGLDPSQTAHVFWDCERRGRR